MRVTGMIMRNFERKHTMFQDIILKAWLKFIFTPSRYKKVTSSSCLIFSSLIAFYWATKLLSDLLDLNCQSGTNLCILTLKGTHTYTHTHTHTHTPQFLGVRHSNLTTMLPLLASGETQQSRNKMPRNPQGMEESLIF